MPPYCRGSKHQKNGLAPLEERKRLCDPPNLPNLISFICLFTINMQPLALFLRKEPGGLSSISPGEARALPSCGKPVSVPAAGAFVRMGYLEATSRSGSWKDGLCRGIFPGRER